MPNPVQRSACDRCHGQKLRCSRSGHGGPCIRCAKGNAVCTWTPSTRRQSKHLTSKPLNFQESSIATLGSSPRYVDGKGIDSMMPLNTPLPAVQPDLDYSALSTCPLPGNPTTVALSCPTFVDLISGFSPTYDLSNASSTADSCLQSRDAASTWQYRFNQEWAMLSAEQQSPLDDGILQTRPGTPRAKSHEDLRLSTIRGLSDLNIEMFTLSSTIPKPPTSTSQPHSWKNKDFSIDKTFLLSQRLIEVLDKMYPRNSASQSHIMTPPLQGDTLPELAPNDSPPFDQSSFLLVLSCYQRLIETYHDIFGNMQACLDRSTVTAREDYVQMPDMKVGSFLVPDSSALQITMILQLSRHLLRRMGAIIKSLKANYNGSGTNDLMSLTFNAVNSREDELIETINKLRNSLVSLDIL